MSQLLQEFKQQPVGGVSMEHEECGKYIPVKSFSNGSIFCAPIQTNDSMNVRIGSGSSLTLTTVTYQYGTSDASLHCKVNGSCLTCLCNVARNITVAGLGLELVGPQEIKLYAMGASVNVWGSVSKASFEYIEPMENDYNPVENETTKHAPLERKMSDSACVEEEDSVEANVETTTQEKSRKRKMNDELPQSTDENVADEHEKEETPAKLSKRQRRKLAKKKEKELAEAVATLNKHDSNSSSKEQTPTKSVPALTKERRLPGGVLVKDYVIGTGLPVKPGRKVSILYQGAFTTGKVFDKNRNKNNPLSFRQGTGQVIRGLERGLEGMRQGGEREITIPPELGYGKKGSGNVVPPNSTLVFTVQVLKVGGS